jgi:hypothetical protein
MVIESYTCGYAVHACADGRFRAGYEIIDAAGEVIEAWDASQCHATRDQALEEAKNHAEAAVEDLARCTIAIRNTADRVTAG